MKLNIISREKFIHRHRFGLLTNCPRNLRELIYCWKRFIDDVFLIFLGTVEELNQLHIYLNSSHPTMKFDAPQYDITKGSCNYLDMEISINNGHISTDIYRKPTDTPSALLPSSAHPSHTTSGNIFSMAFRLLRIVSSPTLFEVRLSELKENYLLPRDYKDRAIEEAFNRVRQISREEALKKTTKSNNKNNRIVVPLDYNPRLPNQSKVLKKHWKAMVIKNHSLKEIFPEPPMAGLRQGKNLQRLLCRARLSPPPSSRPARTTTTAPGWRKCAGNRRQCPACPYAMEPTNQVTGLYSGYTHTIKENINCQDKNVIYYWKCVKDNCPDYPKCEYIGLSSRRFQDRLCEHRDYAKSANVQGGPKKMYDFYKMSSSFVG